MAISDLIKQFTPKLSIYEDLYRKFHNSPELSLCEEATASIVAQHLQCLEGFEVRTRIGGFGVVGVLRNGEAATVLLRAELDALPIAEKTQLPYASTRTMKDPLHHGIENAVMHACG